MLKGANLGKEIQVTVKNEVGVLFSMAKILADHGINVEATSAYVVEDKGFITLMTDDNLRAKEALQGGGYPAEEKDIVLVDLENKPGALKVVTNKLVSEGIDIQYEYCTACPGGCPTRMILSTSDNQKALLALKK
jgi:hypothetical protein